MSNVAAGKPAEHVVRVVFRFRFPEDFVVDDHGGVRREHRQVRVPLPDGLRLFVGKPQHVFVRRFAGQRRFVDVGRRDHVGHADEL